LSDEGRLLEKRSQGEVAQAVLENTLFKEAVEHVRNAAYKQFKSSAAGEEGRAERDVAHMKIRVLEDIVTRLTKHMKDGQRSAKALIEE
jgi:hypothetical protein